MKIEYLVQRSFNTTHPHAGINSIEKRLRDNSFLVVMDKGSFLGILIPSDIIESPHQLVIDCMHDKPHVNCEKDIDSVLTFMKETRNYVLPVFEKDEFIGVVTRAAITDYLSEYRRKLKREISERTAELVAVNEQLNREIQERKRAKERLRISQEYAKNIIKSSLDIIITTDTDLNIVEFNKAAEKAFGYRRDDIVGTPVDILLENPQECRTIHKKTMDQGKCEQEIIYRCKNGQDFPCLLSASPLRDAHGNVVGVMGISRDISDAKRANEQIKASLKEKEMFLREIHHRVKNNLQIISSLLDLRIIREDNQHVIDVFQDTRSKIQTMALIHSQLYESERFDRINMGNYVQNLVNYLSSIFVDSDVEITHVIEYTDVCLSINQAIPCALVLNELISNAFKHAFKGRKKGRVEISLMMKDHNKIVLTVKDNGIGIPEEIDILKTDSLGLKLMRNTVQDQLMGKIHFESGAGNAIMVEFKIVEEEVTLV